MNPFKKLVRSALARCGYEIRKIAPAYESAPLKVLQDIFGRKPPRLIFDVGAHHGETASHYAQAFPDAIIHSFEPSPESFAALVSHVAHLPNVKPVNLALGDTIGERTLHLNQFSPTNSLLKNASELMDDSTAQLMKPVAELAISVRTVDDYCRSEEIEFIDLLKMDVQGFELHVLRGAQASLAAEKVAMLYLEICFEHLYEGQASFSRVYDCLIESGFQFVDFYDQVRAPHHALRWCDALFIHPAAFQRSRSSKLSQRL
jgi:FkbM family methyltransferase